MQERIDALKSRSALYRMFGDLLYREVSEQWLAQFRSWMKPGWETMGCVFDEDMDLDTKQLKEALDAEFSTLWIVPGAIPRFESVFETGMVFQAPCDKVTEIYRSEGYAFDADAEKTFSDHAGVELEFLGHLLDKQANALADNNPEEAERVQKIYMSFLCKHAGTWVPAMMNYSIQTVEHSFYRELCKLILLFMESEFEEELPRREREHLMGIMDRKPAEVEYDADFRKASGL